jgi:GDP-4-dehydro-6-deoxy-D-mannose reductase
MRALVTGASGFVGPYLLAALGRAGYEVVATGVDDSAPIGWNTQYQYIGLDIQNPEQAASVVQQVNADVVFHLAGIAFVPHAEADFDRALSINTAGVHNVMKALTRERFVFISSGEVYGAFRPEELPLSECQPCRPLNCYAISKMAAEKVVERHAHQRSIKSVILRPFNHIGPGQSDLFAVGTFSKQIAMIKLGMQEPKLRVGNLDVKIDFLDVRDVVEAYALMGKSGEGLYNVCSGVSVSLREVIKVLSELANVNVEIEIDPARFRPAERPEILGCNRRLNTEFGWQPKFELRQTLSDCLENWITRLTA